VEVYHKAVVWLLRHNEFVHKNTGAWALEVLDRGLLRASQQARGEAPWLQQAGVPVVRGFRSNIDGSVQPYVATFPHGYGSDKRKRYRLDIVLHGRNADLTEVAFLYQNRGHKEAPKDLSHVRLDIYGRGNNAYRWAGETDVFEAVGNFLSVESMLGRASFVDESRFVLRGFSMGGAGTWHLGLHRPDTFCVLGPGAGFTKTIGYATRLPDPMPDYVRACLHIYDAVDYAENAFNVPVVAYSGEKDPQIAAARNIEAELKKLGLSMTHLVAPSLEHQFPPAWQKKAEQEYAKHAARGRPESPLEVRFVTYTLKYPSCFWVTLLGLDRHYQRAHVQARRHDQGFRVKTANVRALRLALWPGATREGLEIDIDGQKLAKVIPYQERNSELAVYLERRDKDWASVLPERLFVERLRRPRKSHNLQGPIDDAFTSPFLCVRGTGEGWRAGPNEHAGKELERFRAEWSKYLRGEVPVKNDTDVTPDDIASRHLVLFGDPASNSLIEQVLPGLPLKWNKKTITWRGKEHDASKHLPVLIYPSPLASDRYVVLNSGHTFGAAAFEGTNALLFPRLGDFALLKVPAGKEGAGKVEIVQAGLFDDFWRLP
jgi:pimeloyl-ACP methyl ester carboxylesterase